jgi:shikimate dehydrogenase
MGVDVVSFEDPRATVDLTIATLPSGTALPLATAEQLAQTGGALFDAAYAPWPSALAASWGAAPVVSGLGMLLHQAVRQIRLFAHGDPGAALPQEERVLSAMRDAL